MDEESYLFCMPALPEYRHTIVTVDHCCLCGRAVWRSASSRSDLKAICAPCGLEQMGEQDEITIMPPTREQLADIEAQSKRENN